MGRHAGPMATDLPPELRELAEQQLGILSRAQVLQAGLSRGVIRSRIDRGSWQLLSPGVYAVSSGQPVRDAVLWAAVLDAGPGAMLSHETAAEVEHLTDTVSSGLHVTVPGCRRVRGRPGITIHYSGRAVQAVHPARTPPRTRIEETVLDLWGSAASLDDAVSWVARGLGRRLTTQPKLRQAAGARSRLRRRPLLAELLSPDAAGQHSILEHRYVRDVERPHRLPAGTRQANADRGGRTEYRTCFTRNTALSSSSTAAWPTRATLAGRTSGATTRPPPMASPRCGTAGYRSRAPRATSLRRWPSYSLLAATPAPGPARPAARSVAGRTSGSARRARRCRSARRSGR